MYILMDEYDDEIRLNVAEAFEILYGVMYHHNYRNGS